MPLHIGIAGPIATRDVAHLLDAPVAALPEGCDGAPLLVTLIGELLRRGHRVSAFTLSNGMPLRAGASLVARGPRLEIHYAPNRPRAWPPNGWRPGRIVDLYAFERQGLLRSMRSARPDVIHAHWSYEFAWASLRSGLPHVVTCHDSPLRVARFERDFTHGAYRWLRAGIAWHVLREARRVTTVSPYMVGEVQPLCRVPVSIVPNPIAERAATRRRAASANGMKLVMVSNGWGPRKNGAAGLRAFALLARKLPGVELHLYGHDGEPGGAAQRWWQQEGLSGGVVFHGAVSHDEVLDAMASSDLLLHPAIEESFGAVLGEAMAMGLPLVAGERCGAVPWVVGDAGRLVDVTRPECIAEAIESLLTDTATMTEMGRRGRDRVQACFSPAAVATLYEREYEAALGGLQSPARVGLIA